MGRVGLVMPHGSIHPSGRVRRCLGMCGLGPEAGALLLLQQPNRPKPAGDFWHGTLHHNFLACSEFTRRRRPCCSRMSAVSCSFSSFLPSFSLGYYAVVLVL